MVSLRKSLFNVPNILTYGRIATIPLLMALMMSQSVKLSMEANRDLSYWAAFVFILAGISDIVDGYYARKYNMVSLLGKFVDPVADKLVHMAVMVLMIPLLRMPAWLVVVLLFREIVISGLRSVAAAEGVIIDAGSMGKKKTAFLNVGLSGLLLYYPIWGIDVYSVGWICLIIGSVLSIISGVQYIVDFFKVIAKRKGGPGGEA